MVVLRTGSILRYVRGCTNLQIDGEHCKSPLSEGGGGSTVDSSASGQDGGGSVAEQPARTCIWTCNWDGCNNAPLSAASRIHHRMKPVAVSLAIVIISITIMT